MISWRTTQARNAAVRTLQVNLLLQATVLLAAPSILMGSAGLLLFAVVAGFNYGGILVLYAACAARIWGAENVGQVYGWLFSANIPAATFPVLAGFGYDRWQSFIIPLSVIAVLLLAATIGVQRLGGTIGTSSRHCRPLQQS